MVIVGFVTSGILIKDAFLDWAQNPVVTTLDSIASPVNLIQFPTITACDDEYKPPDGGINGPLHWGIVAEINLKRLRSGRLSTGAQEPPPIHPELPLGANIGLGGR